MPLLHWKTAFATVFFAAAFSELGPAQVLPPSVLEIDVENAVLYYEDSTDFSKLGTVPGVTTAAAAANFRKFMLIGDIVGVNGQPVRGTATHNGRQMTLRTAPNPGEGISDTIRNGLGEYGYEFLTSEGTPIGTIVVLGLGGGSPAPGAPLSITQANYAIVGGTGAFLGARGSLGQSVTPQPLAVRSASITEDPANRRTNGGGRIRWALQVIPMSRPEIPASPTGPAVFHADFSPVTAAKPARAGEVLIARATGLGPTRPGVNPGQPFPTDALQQVNSPVVVTMNGR